MSNKIKNHSLKRMGGGGRQGQGAEGRGPGRETEGVGEKWRERGGGGRQGQGAKGRG